MGLISGFANQAVELEKAGGTDGSGDHVPGEKRTIRARFEPAFGSKRTATGELVEVESYVLSEAEIALGDRIEGSEVVRVETIIGKNGKVLGYEAWL